MHTERRARLFRNGRNQALRIPREFDQSALVSHRQSRVMTRQISEYQSRFLCLNSFGDWPSQDLNARAKLLGSE